MLRCGRRPKFQSSAITTSTSPSSTLTPVLQETLATTAELVNSYAARVLNVRSEEHSKLELREFYELFNKTWEFVVRTEVLSRRMIVGLRGVIVSQVGDFHEPRFVLSRLNGL
jgi:vacuolar protein sorting-associated protein 54